MKVYLNVRSCYSFLKSIIKINDYVAFGKEKKLSCLALVDDNLHALPSFYNECIKNKIKPIVGLRLIINSEEILVIAKNSDGLKQLYKLATKHSVQGLEIPDLNQDNENLIFIGDHSVYEKLDQVNHRYINKEKRVVAYLNKDDEQYLKVLKAIGDLDLDHEMSFASACNNMEDYDFIDDINIVIDKKEPKIPSINGKPLTYNIDYLKTLSVSGLEKRLGGKVDNIYSQRLKYELDVIINMGFVNYFLIVYDYVLYAKKSSILVGPGRGSAAGSLVAYSLGITDIDPIKYQLIFERFLNPERISMPDIDLDFPYDERDNVIKYIANKYGSEHVSGIITYGTLGAKQVFRDVLKVRGVNNIIINEVTKLIDGHKSISENLNNPRLKVKLNGSVELKKSLDIALVLEGLPRHTSSHAAGIVISDEPLTEVMPLVANNDILLSGFSMEYLENLGLLKMDILAIKNLTLISNVLKEVGLNFNDIKLDDKDTFEIFGMGLTEGIFQFEADGMKKFLKELKPNCFMDLVAATALYRPGPMQFIYDYAKRKNNIVPVTYLDKSLTPILKDTYGIIIYQEQIMQIAVSIAGFSYSKADTLRKAMSKKDKKLLIDFKQSFITGGLENGYSESLLNKIYEDILMFANYGFNKAHAVSYATISYKMAFLKKHYPVQFMRELLNINITSDNKLALYKEECEQLKINILKPDINLSSDKFILYNGSLVFPLLAIKGLGNVAVKTILDERNNGEYKSIYDFVARTFNLGIKESSLLTLIKAGVFDSFNINKQSLVNNIVNIVNYGNLISSIDQDLILEPSLELVDEYSEKDLLLMESELFGFYLSSHPVIKYKTEKFVVDISSLDKCLGKTVKLVGMITRIKEIVTKKGDKMAFITICDETGKINITCFPNLYQTLNNEKGDIIKLVGEVNNHNNELSVIAKTIEKVEY